MTSIYYSVFLILFLLDEHSHMNRNLIDYSEKVEQPTV